MVAVTRKFFQNGVIVGLLVASLLVQEAEGLQCYQCGQYNDGVGSITPCINESYMKLKECPSKEHKFCIKYLSEGSTVKDCTDKCTDKDDLMPTIRFLCVDLYNYNLIKIITKSIILIHLIVNAVEVYYFLTIFDINYFVVKGQNFFVTLLLLPLSRICLDYNSQLFKLCTSFTIKPLTKADGNYYERVKRYSQKVTCYLIGSQIIAIISAITYVIPTKEDYDMFFAMAFFRDNFLRYSNFLGYCYKLTFMVMPFVFTAPFYILIYGVIYVKTQGQYMLEIFKSEIVLGESSKRDLMHDAEYQGRIWKNLKVLLLARIELSKIIDKCNKMISTMIFSISILFVLTTISIAYFALMFDGIAYSQLPRIFFLGLTSALVALAAIFHAQQIRDSLEEGLQDICLHSNWYNWNQNNKKMFAMVILVCQKEIALRFSQNISIDYHLGASILKSIFSVLSVLSRLQQTRCT